MNPVKLSQMIATALAGLVATKALDIVWKRVFGHKPTLDPDDGDGVPVREILLFAAISGVIGTLAQIYARRTATKFVAKSLDKGGAAGELEG